MYGEVKGVVEKGLNDVSDVAIRTDAWTSLATESYVTVMDHYITKEWQMKSAVLDTSQLDERHSAENLAIPLELLNADWNLEGKIIVCDLRERLLLTGMDFVYPIYEIQNTAQEQY